MRGENLFPSMMAYTKVMDVLSKHGYGALVSEVMDLIKNKEWLSAGEQGAVCCWCDHFSG